MKRSFRRCLSLLLSCLLMLSSFSGWAGAFAEEHVHDWAGEHEFDVQEQAAQGADDPTRQHRVYLMDWDYPTCSICGIRGSGDPVNSSDRSQYRDEDHDWNVERTECKVCGYQSECQHEHVEQHEWYDVTNVLQSDESGHEVEVQYLTGTYCLDCDRTFNIQDAGEGMETGAHEWEGGNEHSACWVCGYENLCRHENAYEEHFTHYETDTAVVVDETTHKVQVAKAHQMRCPDCDVTWNWALLEELHEESMAHEWDGNAEHSACWVCGYENPCQHEHVEQHEWYDVTNVLQSDESGHEVEVQYLTGTYCLDCDHTFNIQDTGVGTETGAHEWEGENEHSACRVCGYENPCQHEHVEQHEWYDVTNVLQSDESGHEVEVQYLTGTYCLDCDHTFNVQDTGVGTETGVHEWDGENESRTCWVCGYANPCQHENAYEEYYTHYETETAVVVDDSTHKLEVAKAHQMRCPNCEATWDFELLEELHEETMEHEWDDENEGRTCWVCGFEKPEPTATPTAEPTATPTAEPTAPPTAEPTATPTAEPTATPTAEPTAIPTVEPTKKPVKTPTPVPMPTVIPLEPIVNYEDVPEDKTVHGIAVVEEQRMAVALATVVEQIEQDSGAGVEIKIVNAEKVFTLEEKAMLDVLPVREQMLILLTAVGYGDEVEYALTSMEMTLSDDARQLSEQIQQRVNNATEEEKAALEQMMLECFPVETVEIDGVAYDYFVIELQIVKDDQKYIERYGFRYNEDGEWIFTRLSIGSYAE